MKIKLPSFEINVVAAIILSVITVGSIGIYAYKTMTNIVNSISEEGKPDVKLTLLKDIFSDLSNAEVSVKSYSITNNSEYLSTFYSAVLSADNKIHELYKISKTNREQIPAIDSISTLTEDKFFILQELMQTRNHDRVGNTLARISKKITDTQKNEAQKPGIKLPVLKHQKMTQELLPHGSVKQVQKEIVKITQQEAEFTEGYKKEQLELTIKDKIVTDKIRSLILRLEDEERKNIILKTLAAKNMATRANRLIAVFCAVVSLLLLILGYQIIIYTSKNKAYNKALTNAKTEAENLAHAKETFLANMSHEIRTPMNAIAGFTEQVLKSSLQPEQKSQLEIVKKSSDHLLKILNEILDLSKVGAGKLVFENIAFRPVEVFEEVVMLMKHEAEKKNLTLHFISPKEIPPVLIGDPVRLKQILINLTGNAIKFTNTGEVRIEAASQADHEKKIFLKVVVSDTGIGIPKKDLPGIFNEFKQAESSTSRKYGGTGLGLSICKKLVELQKGNIHIQSEESKGTSVIFTIPFITGSETDIIHEAEAETGNNLLNLKGKKILIADDSEFNRKLIVNILTNLDVSFAEAINGKEVIDLLERSYYDVILMDMLMPEMNGLEATIYIREHFKGKKSKVPIIALTAAGSDDTVKRCMEAGMNDFLSKPFKEDELLAKIISVINPEVVKKSTRKNKKTKVAAPLTDKSKNKQNAPPYNLEELERNGDQVFVREMIEVFVRTTNDGIMEIKKAFSEKDYERIADQAHLIASPCRHIEALSLLQIIKDIEDIARKKSNVRRLPSLIEQMEKKTDILLPLLKKEIAKRKS